MDRLDQQRERILDDLRGLLAGEVRGEAVFRQLYASDGSIHEIRPLAVVRPRHTRDVVACVQYAAERGITIHARGAGTGVAGESLGPGLVVDFSWAMRRILRVESDCARVQPGVVLERFNAELRRQGRQFGPDPSRGAMTTIGSVISVDAAGSRWLKYGSARRHVRSLQLVLADGHVIEAGREPLVEAEGVASDRRKRELVAQLGAVLAAGEETIRRGRPRSLLGRRGYQLHDVLADGHVDLARLIAGSEGTLALITEATLGTDAVPRHRGVALLLFDRLDSAARAGLEILQRRPTACDLMDRRHLSLARENEVRFDLLVPSAVEAALLVERESDDAAELREWLQGLTADMAGKNRAAMAAHLATDPDEVALFWQLAAKARPALYRVKGVSRPVPVVDDAVVPPDVLPEFLVRVQNVLKRHEVTASLLAHAGQGQLHLHPLLNIHDPADVERMRRVAADFYQEVIEAGGAPVGEHAFGLSRSALPAASDPSLYEVMRQVKKVFDPGGLFNPGKIIDAEPDAATRHLRPPLLPRVEGRRSEGATGEQGEPPDAALRDLVELQLDWDPRRISGVVADCNRCGECRTQAPDSRMCPLLRAAPSEEASPRAKANLLRGILTGRVPLELLTLDSFKQVADLCFHCHMCRVECPARVDIPRLMREAKAAHVAANALPHRQWLVAHLESLAALGSLVRPAANWALSNRLMRWLLERTFGVAQGRKLPQLASPTFLRWAARRRLTRPSRRGGRKVAYFVDLYANYFDPQLAAALVAVLEHNGVSVFVPPAQRFSGMPAIALGAIEPARRLARRNVSVLADAVRQGYHVIATEPSAALCLKREYPQLLEDDDAQLVADNASEACTYLWRMHTTGQLQLDFDPLPARLAYHAPCHLKALEVGAPGLNLLRLIPGMQVHDVEAGCSGMAGTFGLSQRNYRASLRIGWSLITRLRDPDVLAGTTECSACKIQMEQGTTKPTIHPLKLLALAYRLMPELSAALVAHGKELVVT